MPLARWRGRCLSARYAKRAGRTTTIIDFGYKRLETETVHQSWLDFSRRFSRRNGPLGRARNAWVGDQARATHIYFVFSDGLVSLLLVRATSKCWYRYCRCDELLSLLLATIAYLYRGVCVRPEIHENKHILPTRTPHLHPPGQETANVLAGTPNGPAVSLPTEKVESNVHFVVSSVWNLANHGISCLIMSYHAADPSVTYMFRSRLGMTGGISFAIVRLELRRI